MASANWLQSRRQAAWASGRELRDRLLAEYVASYHPKTPPAPALVAAELLRDFLDADLHYDPLAADRYAMTTVEDGQVVVTVNSEIARIEGVKDPQGVENVAVWHEMIHVAKDVESLLRPATLQLPGFEEPPSIVCYRAGANRPSLGADRLEREFWAEEAGRAAAVSLEALSRSAPFQELMQEARRGPNVRGAWPLLYKAAQDIGVNITALVKQLSLEGRIVVEGGEVVVQPGLGEP